MPEQETTAPEWMAVCAGDGRVLYWVAADGARRPPHDPPLYADWHPDMRRVRA